MYVHVCVMDTIYFTDDRLQTFYIRVSSESSYDLATAPNDTLCFYRDVEFPAGTYVTTNNVSSIQLYFWVNLVT